MTANPSKIVLETAIHQHLSNHYPDAAQAFRPITLDYVATRKYYHGMTLTEYYGSAPTLSNSSARYASNNHGIDAPKVSSIKELSAKEIKADEEKYKVASRLQWFLIFSSSAQKIVDFIVSPDCGLEFEMSTRLYFRATPLLAAVTEKRFDVVQRMIKEHSPNIRAIDQHHCTALHLAVRNGSLEIVRYLVEVAGCDPFTKSLRNGWAPFDWAVYENYTEIAHYLIQKGIPPSALHSVVSVSLVDISLFTFILESGRCDVNAVCDGVSVLCKAVDKKRKCVLIVNLLLEHGANPNINPAGNTTPLQIACRDGWLEGAQSLVAYGAHLNGNDRPLIYAVACGFSEVALFLLECGADPNICDGEGKRPLLFACYEQLHVVVETLVRNGALLDVFEKRNEHTALHWAINNKKNETAILLLELGADPQIANRHKQTPLHLACYRGMTTVAKLLLTKGASPNTRTQLGDLPIGIVVHNNFSKEIAMLLLEYGAIVEGKSGEEILRKACKIGMTNVVKFILSKNELSVNAVDRTGNPPLNWAIAGKHFDVIQLLLSFGADVNLLNKNSESSLEHACKRNLQEAIKLLIAHGCHLEPQNLLFDFASLNCYQSLVV